MSSKKYILILYLFWCTSAGAQIMSTFETDADGWTFFDGTTAQTVVHQSGNGNPDGYISVTYSASTGATTESWFAPTKFLGSHLVRSLGMNLRFDLQQSIAGTASISSGDVRIEGSGTNLVYSLPVKPAVAPAWSSYVLRLDETQGWRINSTTGALATRTQIMDALTNITSIEIRGTFSTNASHTSGLDNVILEQRTLLSSPAITSFTPTSGKPGTSITITGSDFESNAAQNEVYFGSVRGTITAASTTQLVVTVPIGATYGPLTVINKTTGLLKRSGQPFIPLFDDGGRIIPASFNPKVDILLDPTPGNDLNGLAVADLDGDGWSDVLTAEQVVNSVSIFRNLGNGGDLTAGSFDSKFSLSGAGNSPGLHTTDLNGDGKLDIIAGYSNGSTVYFATYRNTSTPGNLSFEPVELWAGNTYSGSVSNFVDVDGDGLQDLIGQHGNGSVFPDFWIAQNISTPGNIEFGSSVSYFTNALDAGAGVGVGDLDNDGKPDLVVSHGFGGTFSILKNNSTPSTISLENLGAISTGQYNRSIQVADFNLDGKNDIAFKFNGTQDIRIRVNTNSGGALSLTDFDTEVVLISDLGNYGGMSIADINGDGKPDFIASDDGDIGIFENVYTSGPFTANAFVRAHMYVGVGNSTYPTSPLARDLNGDSKPDLVVGITNSSPVRLSFFENKNVIAPSISLNTVSPLTGAIGSTVTITGDNFSTTPAENTVNFGGVTATVLSASKNLLTVEVPAGAMYAPVSVTRNELTARYDLPFTVTFSPGILFDNTSFAPPATFTLTTADYDIDVGDINNDGKPDVIAEGASLFGYAFRNMHTSGPINNTSLLADDTTDVSAANLKLMDINDDGKLDIVSNSGIFQNSSTSGNINFSNRVTSAAGSGNVSWNDFNLDGKTDVFGTTASTNFAVFENWSRPGAFVQSGFTGTFSSQILVAKPGANGGTASADFDRDGSFDIAVTNPAQDNITIYRNTGGYRIAASMFAATNLASLDNPGRIYAGDLDVDGKVDLMMYHGTGTASTTISVYHNQSSSGNITFNRVDYPIGASATVAWISDLDGDGKPEIIVTSEATDQFLILKNTSSPGALDASSFATPFATAVANPRGLTTGDLNLDGKPEIIITSAPNSLLVFENVVPVGPSITITSQPVSAAVCDGLTASLTLTATGTTNLVYQWQKSDGTVFNDITTGGGYSGVTTSTLSINTTGNFGAGIYRCKISGDLASDVFSNTVTLTINTVPAAPTATGGSNCIAAAITLTASGGVNGQYRWYDTPTGGTASAQVNSSFVTPVINTTTTYHVSVNNGLCESTRTAVTASIIPLAKPILTSSITISGGSVNLCTGDSFTLTAPAGFSTYAWSNGASTQQITINLNGIYSVVLTDAAGCISPASDPVTVTVFPYPAADITVNGTQLTASPGDSYQWYQNGVAVAGATDQSFDYTVLEYGMYRVDVTENGCTATSAPFEYLITGTEFKDRGLKIYPNPMVHTLVIETAEKGKCTLHDVLGRKVTEMELKENSVNTMLIHDLPRGQYVLRIEYAESKRYLKIQKN